MGSERPQVSIVLPTTRPDLVPQAIAAIAAQTFRGAIELLLIRDGGPPIDAGAVPFSVRSVGVEPQLGPSLVRNAAMAWATADVIAFCDDDDLWHPEHLADIVAPVRERGGLAFSDALLQHVQEGWEAPFRFRFDEDVLRRTNPIILSTTAVHRDVLGKVGGFDPEFSRYEAWDWFLRIKEQGLPITRVPKVSVTYRYSQRSQTADTEKMAEAFSRFREKHGLGDLPQANFATMAREAAWDDIRDRS